MIITNNYILVLISIGNPPNNLDIFHEKFQLPYIIASKILIYGNSCNQKKVT